MLFTTATIQKNMSNPPIAIVCRPDFLRTLRDNALQSDSKEIVFVPAFAGLPIHEKNDQTEAWRIYYNIDELYNYLSENGTKQISSTNTEIAKMLEKARNSSK